MSMDRTVYGMLSLCFRMILGVVFLYAGIVKIIDPAGFALAISNYRILPDILVNAVAIVLPFLEVFAGAALIAGIVIPGSSLVVTGLLLIFFCALFISLVRGLDISCGCFSTSYRADPVTWLYLVRDGTLIFMGGFVFFFDQGMFSLEKYLCSRKT